MPGWFGRVGMLMFRWRSLGGRCWYVKLSSKVVFFSSVIGVDGTMVEAFVVLDRCA